MWYDITTTMSHNCAMNMVTSARGMGKTVNGLSYMLTKTLPVGEEIVYLRRREADLDECKDELLDDIIEYNVMNIANDYEFRLKKDKIYARPFGSDEEWAVAIRLKALSVVSGRKGTPYPHVKYMLFDEFLIEDTTSGNYLQFEPKKLMAYVSTVFRHRKINLFMFANMYSTENPYFTYFHLNPKSDSIFTKDRERGILIHKWEDEEFDKMAAETDMAKLVRGTSYGDFILHNKAVGDDTTYIGKATGNLSYYFTVVYNEVYAGCWVNRQNHKTYFTKNHSHPRETIYTADTQLGSAHFMLKNMTKAPFYKFVMKQLENTNVTFETVAIKQAVLEAFGYR